jgi:hypothetical protein
MSNPIINGRVEPCPKLGVANGVAHKLFRVAYLKLREVAGMHVVDIATALLLRRLR